eukprot:5079655-Prymnesium_polylepis.1
MSVDARSGGEEGGEESDGLSEGGSYGDGAGEEGAGEEGYRYGKLDDDDDDFFHMSRPVPAALPDPPDPAPQPAAIPPPLLLSLSRCPAPSSRCPAPSSLAVWLPPLSLSCSLSLAVLLPPLSLYCSLLSRCPAPWRPATPPPCNAWQAVFEPLDDAEEEGAADDDDGDGDGEPFA